MTFRSAACLVAAITAGLMLAACAPPQAGEAGEPGPQTAGAPQADAPLSRAASLAMACSGCHGDGAGAVISLNGLPENALVASLTRYKAETEGTTVMHRLMRGYSDTDIAAVSRYIAEGRGE